MEWVDAFNVKKELPTNPVRTGVIEDNMREKKRSTLPKYQKLIQPPSKFVQF